MTVFYIRYNTEMKWDNPFKTNVPLVKFPI